MAELERCCPSKSRSPRGTSSLYGASITATGVLVSELLKLHQLCVVLLVRPLQVFHILQHHLGCLVHTFLLMHNRDVSQDTAATETLSTLRSAAGQQTYILVLFTFAIDI